ncbi:MAG TPA: DUF423 domain-containing protein [Myxococcota bacterium]|jgi:uncharacterized membrane protein YgdD (TMEM256/DUF423 family)
MRTAAILGFTGVLLGAFGAHAIKDWLAGFDDAAERLEWWHTAVLYHLVHALFCGVASHRSRWAVHFGAAGVVLFSGSLYAMTLSGIKVPPLVLVTPLGGLCFLVAWALLAIAAFRRTADPASRGSSARDL